MAVANAAVNSVMRRRRSRAHFNYRNRQQNGRAETRPLWNQGSTLSPLAAVSQNEALAEPGHSGNESDGAVAAANNAGDDIDEDNDFYDDDASDTEHVPSRLSTLGFD